ncbi:MAG: hypothetical protein L0027_04885 [Candidatus Rokubacteria bacterium]|nr:hypothetical protein [Candidatus Rokubacteria bacterium]
MSAEISELGAVEIVVGLPTAGVTPGALQAASSARAALETTLAGHSAVAVHVDATPVDETQAQVTQALGACPLLRLEGTGREDPPPPGSGPAGRRDDVLRTILEVGQRLRARAVVVLNTSLTSTTPAWLGALAEPVLKEDYGLVLPLYRRARHEGTLTRALVTPLVQGLWGREIGYPIAEEFGCSAAAVGAFLESSAWGSELARDGLEFWLPVTAIERGLSIGQAPLGAWSAVAPARPAPLGTTVGRVAWALFALAEGTEAWWLDRRGAEAAPVLGAPLEPLEVRAPVDPERMLSGFRQGVRDLSAIWERILAPEQLAEILDLSDASIDDFHLPDRLWARIVYDFLLGYRFRVVYRHHLAQSLAPLYLGQVASAFLETATRPATAVVEAGARLGREFVAQKPYLVDRWT